MKKSNAPLTILILLLLSACGQSGVTGSQISAQSNGTPFNSQAFYFSLPAPDLSVSISGYFGATIAQRQSSDGIHFCRKTGALVANPTYSYECWKKSFTGSQAQSLYSSASTNGTYGITIGSFIGGGSIQEAVNGDESILCQKSTPQNPSSPSTYNCYSKL